MFKNLNIKALGLVGRQSEVIELSLSYNFKGMDLDIMDFSEHVGAYGLPHARRLIDSARIKLGTFRLPFSWEEWEEDEKSYKQWLEQLPKLAELAQQVGCSRCLTAITPASDERPYHENFEFHRKRISEIAEVLGPYGVSLGIEMLALPSLRKGQAFQFIHTFDALVQLAKMATVDNVGVVIDVWHMYVAGNGFEEIKKLAAEQIVAVFLSDIAADTNLEEVDETMRLLPGETGVINSAAVLTSLAELGYEGPVSPKAHPATTEGMSREAKVKLASQRLAELWAEAGLNAQGKASAAAGG